MQFLIQKMTNLPRLGMRMLLPLFSWARHPHVPSGGLLHVEVMSAHKNFSNAATELTILKNENPHELSYTSLRDLLSSDRHTCLIKPQRECEGEHKELEDERPVIKNRLVELAARAYLLPSHAQATPANQFFSRQWARFTRTWLQSHHSSITLHSFSEADSCLPGPLWVEITRAICSLFNLNQFRPQSVLQL